MRKIRFRYIKENGKSTSVTVRCSVKRKYPARATTTSAVLFS